MTAATGHTHARSRRARRRALAARALAAACTAAALAGCGTSQPRPISGVELAEAQTFPYFRVYWVGPSFDGHSLVAADGLKSYLPGVGDGVYYGNCVQGKGIFAGGSSCSLPLQVTTVVYAKHNNESFGRQQRNLLVRGVPATVYNGGQAIEIYSGRLSIDIFSDTFAHALRAADEVRPINAPGAPFADLPEPVYCPELSGEVSAGLARVLANLPDHVCQRTDAEEAFIKQVKGKS